MPKSDEDCETTIFFGTRQDKMQETLKEGNQVKGSPGPCLTYGLVSKLPGERQTAEQGRPDQ